jgi:hypothetical protein
MNPSEKLDLKKLVSEMEAEDNTEHIRKVKHSVLIRDDIRKLDRLKTDNPGKSYEELLEIAQREASFLFSAYTDIFHKVLRGEIDLTIMTKLLTILKLIEDGKVDQHEGSVMVGKILKELYIDSAIKRGENLDKTNEDSKPQPCEGRQVKWSDWKKAKEIMYGKS